MATIHFLPPANRAAIGRVLEPVAASIHSLQSLQSSLIDGDIKDCRTRLFLTMHMVSCALWYLAQVDPHLSIREEDFGGL